MSINNFARILRNETLWTHLS